MNLMSQWHRTSNVGDSLSLSKFLWSFDEIYLRCEIHSLCLGESIRLLHSSCWRQRSMTHCWRINHQLPARKQQTNKQSWRKKNVEKGRKQKCRKNTLIIRTSTVDRAHAHTAHSDAEISKRYYSAGAFWMSCTLNGLISCNEINSNEISNRMQMKRKRKRKRETKYMPSIYG